MRGLGAALSILTVVALLPGAVAASHASAPASARPGELLVRFEPGASQSRALDAVDARVVDRLPLPGLVRVKLEPGTSLAAAAAAFERRPDVRYAEPNYRYRLMATPNDPSYSSLWGLNQPSDADIDAPEAWDLTTGSDQLTVAVVDTGVEYTHPDLQPNIWTNDDPIDGVDNDGNGKIDDLRGWDFATNTNDPADDHGHGTHVAGTIGARGNNGVGITGVNWIVKVMALKAADSSGSLDDAWIVEAFRYACTNGAKVINGSFGGYGYSQAIHDAIQSCSNSLFVFSAGNDGVDNDVIPAYPCNDAAPNVVCVAASDSLDNVAGFSNHGDSVELAAPGHGVFSTVPGPSYGTMSGTSMAAPHVSGAAALVLAHRPTLTPLELRRALLFSTDRKPAFFGYVETGRLNVARALTQDITPPSVPGLSSTTPVGVWTNTSTISVSWSGAVDQGGIGGYSYSWSPDPTFEPDETKDVDANVTSASAVMPDGQQWFHIRAGDVYGNFSETKHIGPFLIDTFPPVRPTLSSPTHRAGTPSTNRAVEINWASSSDSVSGLDGFSFAWGRGQLVPVDQTKDVEESVFRTTSARLDNGAWWFGIRARDNAGNWSETVVLGPFVITGTAPACNVPRLRGLTLIGAKRQLVKRGCALGRVTRAYSRRVARGRVIAQKRAPGLRLARGAKIGVVLSRGRRARR